MKYDCSMCGVTFESGWSHEEAIAEKERDFGDVSLEECDVVCDDCYQQVIPANNPEAMSSYLEYVGMKIEVDRFFVRYFRRQRILRWFWRWWVECDYLFPVNGRTVVRMLCRRFPFYTNFP